MPQRCRRCRTRAAHGRPGGGGEGLTSPVPCPAGTFITEWQEGGRQCEAFLAGDERSYQAVADQLVLIAQVLRFDGWLVNIENALSVSAAPAWRPPRPAAPPRVLASPRPTPEWLPEQQQGPPLVSSEGQLPVSVTWSETEPCPALRPGTSCG